MPRGRHRHSPPLHRFLPPAAVALVAVACAAAAWFLDDLLVVRALAAVAAAAAVTDAVLARVWDRAAGRRVADLTRARTRDEWHSEERVAELETEVEEARTRRTALESALRAKRAELARMRSEHAELLRRYATAETKHANALEGRRLLELETATPQGLPRQDRAAAGAPTTSASGAGSAPGRPAVTAGGPAAGRGEAGADPAVAGAERPAVTLDAAAYQRAAEALRHFARNASRQTWNRHVLPPGAPRAAGTPSAGTPSAEAPADDADAPDSQAPGSKAPASEPSKAGPPSPDAAGERGAADAGVAAGDGAQEQENLFAGRPADAPVSAGTERRALARRGAGPGSHPAAATVSGRRTMSRQVGGFDFFGTSAVRPAEEEAEPQAAPGASGGDRETTGGPRHAEGGARRALGEDLADVVGDEAVADKSAHATEEQDPAAGEVIDLTSHDETEQLDLGVLRNSASG